jgi:hypothetical protein
MYIFNYHLTINNVTLINICFIHVTYTKFMQEHKFDSDIKFRILNNKLNLLTLSRGEKAFKHLRTMKQPYTVNGFGQILNMMTFLTHN